MSLRTDPSCGEHGCPSGPSGTDSAGHAGVSVEILSTMLDRQSKLDTTAFLLFRTSAVKIKIKKNLTSSHSLTQKKVMRKCVFFENGINRRNSPFCVSLK